MKRLALAGAFALAASPLAAFAQQAPPTPPPLTSPSASPAPSPAAPAPASPSASPLPSPAASPPASNAPPRFDRASAGVAPGATIAIPLSGGSEPIAVTSSFDAVDARYDAAAHALVLTGRARGSGSVTVTDATGATATIAVLVAPPAGVVPPAVEVTLAGNVGRAFALARVRDAVAAAAQLQPGSALDVSSVALPDALPPGTTLDLAGEVRIDGHGGFVDVAGPTTVRLRVLAATPFDPRVLLYSDDPEYVRASGVLFRSPEIDASRPARAYVYHAATTPGTRVWLVLQSAGSSQVQVLGATRGPSTDYACVGHRATANYLVEHATEESFVATATAAASAVIPLSARDLAPQELVNAIYDLRVLSGDPVRAVVVATTAGEDPRSLQTQAELPGDGHGRKGVFAIGTVRPVDLRFTAGSEDDPSFVVGQGAIEGVPEFPNLIPGGHPLAGDYGVLRPLRLTLANPTPTPQTVYLTENAANGPVTTTIWFAGDPAPVELGPARDRSTAYGVRGFPLAPGETRTVSGVYMTDGASWFPMDLSLTTQPPVPLQPSACAS